MTLKKIYFLPLILILFLTGCSKRDQRIINNFNNRPNDFEQTKDDVTVGGKLLSNNEFNAIYQSPSFFARKKTVAKYQAIQINIINDGENFYLFNKNCTTLNLICPEKIFEELKASAYPRGIFGGLMLGSAAAATTAIGSFVILFPFLFLAALAQGSHIHCNTSSIENILIYAPLIAGITVGLVSGIWIKKSVDKQNNQLKQKIYNATDYFQEKIVRSKEKYKFTLFLNKKEIKNNFSLFLLNPVTKEKDLEFNINLVPECIKK